MGGVLPANLPVMALNIKDPDTDRLARELAALTGESITVALKRSIEERLAAVRRRRSPRPDLSGIIRRGRARVVLTRDSEDAILGYGDDGMPR